MKKTILYLLFLLPFISFSQTFKKTDLKLLYENTIKSIKTKDSILFLTQWEPDSIQKLNGGALFKTTHTDYLLENYRALVKDWTPVINSIKLKAVETTGQIICFIVYVKPDKNKTYFICSSVNYYNAKVVYSTNSKLDDKMFK